VTGQIVYDADCGFCTRSAFWVDADPVAWQSLDLAAVGATEEQADSFAGWLVGGRVVALGAPAIAAALRDRGGWTAPVGRLIDLPGVRRPAAVVYRLVARHRHRLPGGTAACRIDDRS
jgi:predicted DCC family thiol-disulfide oxidoreductase YuxK